MPSTRFNANSTTEDVLEGVDLTGKRAVVTGCNAGIGFETARALASAGATVVLPCRSLAKSRDTAERILSQLPAAHTEAVELDLSSLKSVAAFCASQRGKALDILVGNAGIFPTGYSESADGIESCFAVCHLGHFPLCAGLLDELKQSKARVVMVSSGSHRKPPRLNFDNLPPKQRGYSPMSAYGQAKLANVLFAKELQRRLDADGVIANALHPGALIATSIGRNSLLARIAITLAKPFTKTLSQGAATSVLCAASPSAANAKGEYFQDCQVARASKEACDPTVAQKLWELSEALLLQKTAPA
ncbi:MAG TPA: SDR family oxidoreductase [Polyangiaceae bacterium]|nr:SDR family oxidoreductase [Polyangiaceae bacterium]